MLATMARHRRPPLTLADLKRDGPPLRVRDLVSVTGLSEDTIYREIETGTLIAAKRSGRTSPYLIDRWQAKVWLVQMGLIRLGPRQLPATSRSSNLPTPQPRQFAPDSEDDMSLADTVRSAVALAQRTTSSLQVTVSHEAGTTDGRGDVSYGTAVERDAIWLPRVRSIRRQDGTFAMSLGKLTFLENVSVGQWDRFTIPSTATAADIQGDVLEVAGVADPLGGTFAVEVWVG